MADLQRIKDAEQALNKAIQQESEVLAQATTIPSFQRTQLILNRTKLVIEKRSPFGARDIVSLRVEDILSATAAAGPIFGTIKINAKPTSPKPLYSIGLFWRNDTIELKRTIQGYVIALQRKIDVDVLPVAELKILLNELGTDDHTIN